MKRVQKTNLSPYRSVATLQAETLNEESRTVEMTFYSGAPIFRFPLFDDPYELEFEISKKAADLSRLNAGAPLIDSHGTYKGLSGMLGVVEKAWLADGVGRARVRFSKRPEAEAVWQDVMDGVIRNVSMGTYIFEMEEVTAKGAEMKRMRATSWQPYEISLVPVPADMGAQVLEAEGGEQRPCTITMKAATPEEGAVKIKVRLLADVEDLGSTGDIIEIEEEEFDKHLHTTELALPKPKPAAKPATPAAASAASEDEDEAQLAQRFARDKRRREKCKEIARFYDLDEVWAEAQHQSGCELTQIAERAEAERRKRAPRPSKDVLGFGNDYEDREFKLNAMADAMVARAKGQKPDDAARPYYGRSFAELALAAIQLQGKGRGLDPRADRSLIFSANLALHTTSDFPLLLANALNKMLLPEYRQATATYRQIAVQRNFRDFRVHNFDRSGDFPMPLQVGEHGEYQYGTMGENQEQVTLLKYGRILGISYEALVNDDLGAFANLATKSARRVVDFENATFYTVCILAGGGLGPNLSDTNPVYDAAHTNLLSGGVLNTARLDEARQLMMAQTSIDGLKLNVMPRYLLTSPVSAGLAERLVAPQSMLLLAGTAGSVTQASSENNWAGRLTPIADANLTGARYYLLADPADLEQYVYGYLEGSAGPRTEVRNGFETDGVEFKLALEFGCGAVEYRAGVTGAGS